MNSSRACIVLALVGLLSLYSRPAAAWDPLQKAPRAAQEAGKQLAAGESAEAVESYSRAQALNPDEPDYRMGLGEALFVDEDLEAAMAQFLAAADPQQPELAQRAYYNAGNTALAMGELEKALELYEMALLSAEPSEDLLHNLELTQRMLEQGQPQENQQQDQEQQQEQDQEDQENQEEQDQENQQQDQEQQNQEEQEQEQEQQDQEQQENEAPPDSLQMPPQPPDSSQVAPPDSMMAMPEGMSPEEAMRLLEALDHDEEELRRSIQRRLRGTETESENDW